MARGTSATMVELEEYVEGCLKMTEEMEKKEKKRMGEAECRRKKAARKEIEVAGGSVEVMGRGSVEIGK